MSNTEVKYAHIRLQDALYHCGKMTYQAQPRGGVTVAYVLYHNERNNTLVIDFATAECSDKDNYCRATGRAIASGRLQSPKHCNTFTIEHTNDGARITGAVIDHALSSLPRWGKLDDLDDDEVVDLSSTSFALGPKGNPL
jgi:hypothetical protein